jgi:uncharacterized protein
MPRPRLEQRLACRERPHGQPVMYHRWRELLFVHWVVPSESIQRTLPPGLTVDTWEGKAYVGIVPFFMRRVRPRGIPPLPWVSNFLEMNVRTYVHDVHGNPGVWFYSLDCNQPITVWGARNLLSLPYFNAQMSAPRVVDGLVDYQSRRRTGELEARFRYGFHGEERLADPESLDFFLIERYLLFSFHRDRVHRAQVHHAPYRLSDATLPEFSIEGVSSAGVDYRQAPVHLIGSPGVDVEVFAGALVG